MSVTAECLRLHPRRSLRPFAVLTSAAQQNHECTALHSPHSNATATASHCTAARWSLRSSRRRSANPRRKKGRRVKYADPWKSDGGAGCWFLFVFVLFFVFFFSMASALSPAKCQCSHAARMLLLAVRYLFFTPHSCLPSAPTRRATRRTALLRTPTMQSRRTEANRCLCESGDHDLYIDQLHSVDRSSRSDRNRRAVRCARPTVHCATAFS